MAAGAPHVIMATGSHWRADGRGRHYRAPQPGFAAGKVLTPDDVMAGTKLEGPVVVFDDDGYYMGSVIAELLARPGPCRHLCDDGRHRERMVGKYRGTGPGPGAPH